MFSQRRIQTASHGCMALTFIACVLLSILPAAAQQMARTDLPMRPQVVESYGKLPLNFEVNQGQTDPRVKFLSRGSGYSLFLTSDSAVLSLRGQKAGGAVLRMKLLGANAHAGVAGADALPGKSNYFVGNDPNKWRTNVPTYGAVKYSDVYPGIDLVYHGNQRLLEYDFVVSPGADPRSIDLRFQGAKKFSVNDQGALVIALGGSEVIEHAPVVYQEKASVRKTLSGRYVMRGRGRVGFSVAEYDRSQALVIDPTLVYSTYLGGDSGDEGFGIAVDASGNAYVTGTTASSNFPIAVGFQTTLGGGEYDAFVSKVNAAGSALLYSTYLGGSDMDFGRGIAIDTLGNAYVTGYTYSSDFPTTAGAFQTAIAFHDTHVFVSKLNTAGSSLVYSTYLGQSGGGLGIAVDASGNAYVTGSASSDFPTTPGAFQTTFAGSGDAFVTKLNTAGSALVYSTYVGGSVTNVGLSVAVDASGNAYITGTTGSPDFPVTPDAFQTTLSGQENAFVTKLNAAGSALPYSTYLGGSGDDHGGGIGLDASGNAYVTGYTSSSDFPTTLGAFQTTFGGYIDVFVSKLNATGSALLYSTYLGGAGADVGSGIAVDSAGNAYVTGETPSSNFPTTPGAFGTTYAGDGDAFVTELNASGSAVLYSTYLSGDSDGTAIAVDASGNTYVTGITWSGNFPTTPGAFQTTEGVGDDAFVTKLNLGTSVTTPPSTTAALSGPAGNNEWYLGPVTVTLSVTAGSSPVSATYYRVDGGEFVDYGAPFLISSDGTHQLLFYSVDTAGHQETPHGQTIKIDSTPPVSRVTALPATETLPNFNVQWSGKDAGSGVRDFTMFVSDNGSAFTAWLTQTTMNQATFAGVAGHSYGFYSLARDWAGNQENSKTVAEATTQVAVATTKPVSHVAPLPATAASPNFSVQWSGTDTGGPGVSSYTIYVSDNGGPFAPWLTQTTATQAWFVGQLTHSYSFYSIARDNAGNVETKTVADVTTYVPQMEGDVNGDGMINCADIELVKASFGTKTGQAGFNPAADVNKDGVVNVLDLAIVSQKLIPGTKCP
jgi:hypothetical protein